MSFDPNMSSLSHAYPPLQIDSPGKEVVALRKEVRKLKEEIKTQKAVDLQKSA